MRALSDSAFENKINSQNTHRGNQNNQYNSNPSSWLSWITYLLARLGDQAMDVNPANQRRYEEMLSNLQDNIYNRRQTGGW